MSTESNKEELIIKTCIEEYKVSIGDNEILSLPVFTKSNMNIFHKTIEKYKEHMNEYKELPSYKKSFIFLIHMLECSFDLISNEDIISTNTNINVDGLNYKFNWNTFKFNFQRESTINDYSIKFLNDVCRTLLNIYNDIMNYPTYYVPLLREYRLNHIKNLELFYKNIKEDILKLSTKNLINNNVDQFRDECVELVMNKFNKYKDSEQSKFKSFINTVIEIDGMDYTTVDDFKYEVDFTLAYRDMNLILMN